LQLRTAQKQGQTAERQSEAAKQQSQTAEKQAETARNKLRLDLFDRRIVVYDALMKLTKFATENGDVTEEDRRECAIATKGVELNN
jgi:hypothetical protein